MWGIDFRFDSTTDGRPFKIANVIDEHTREILGGQVARSITGDDLADELGRIAADRGVWPAVLRCGNGPELVCAALAQWCGQRTGITFIDPGCPWQNPWIESFHSRLRDECLNLNHFRAREELRLAIITWIECTYHRRRRQRGLGRLTPIEF